MGSVGLLDCIRALLSTIEFDNLWQRSDYVRSLLGSTSI